MKKMLPLFLFLLTTTAFPAVYNITTTADAGAGSLRQAISDANANPGSDIINFSVPGTIILSSNLPTITGNITINGNVGGTSISGNNAFSIFVFTGNSPNLMSATLNDLELMNAYTQSAVGGDGGSAIHAASMLYFAINRCHIHDCRYRVINQSQYLSVHGGAVSVTGSGGCSTICVFYMRQTTLAFNELNATNSMGLSEAYGGGLYTQSLNDTLINCTFYTNKVISTAQQNTSQATATGGGMAFYGCSISVNHCSFIADTAKAVHTGRGTAASGAGGLTTIKYPINIKNALFSGNIATNSPDVGSLYNGMTDITSEGNNAIGNTGGTWSSKKITDTVNTDMQVLPLAANNYWIPTCAISGTSPAYNKVLDGVTITTDERGITRDEKPDAGAFELNNVPLAVGTLHFAAYYCQNKACLQWTTVNEDKISRFLVQRSADAVVYKTVAIVPAAGNGDHDYNAVDATPLNKPNFYRLQQLDKNGSYTYSAVVKLEEKLLQNLSVTPNPAYGFFILQNARMVKNVWLMGNDGRTLRQWNKLPTGRYNISGLPAGVYFLKIENNRGLAVEKLVVR